MSSESVHLISYPTMKPTPSHHNLAINELVLPYIPGCTPHRIHDAIEKELKLLLTEKETSASLQNNRNHASKEGFSLAISPGSTPEAIGKQIAHHLYHSHVRQKVTGNRVFPFV